MDVSILTLQSLSHLFQVTSKPFKRRIRSSFKSKQKLNFGEEEKNDDEADFTMDTGDSVMKGLDFYYQYGRHDDRLITLPPLMEEEEEMEYETTEVESSEAEPTEAVTSGPELTEAVRSQAEPSETVRGIQKVVLVPFLIAFG